MESKDGGFLATAARALRLGAAPLPRPPTSPRDERRPRRLERFSTNSEKLREDAISERQGDHQDLDAPSESQSASSSRRCADELMA
jgi:hypothetical protein